MKKTVMLLITLSLLFAVVIGAIVNTTTSTTVTEFNDRDTEKILSFPAGGSNITEYIELPRNVPVYKAYFNVSNLDDGSGIYPTNLTIDVGNDGDYEWGFVGTGYGAMGRQNYFSDGRTSKDTSFDAPGTDQSALIKLPKNATITGASMRLTGDLKEFYEKTMVDPNEWGIQDMCAADIDNDSVDDIVCTLRNSVVWYKNVNGDGTTWNRYFIDNSVPNGFQVFAADIDGDLDIDVAITDQSLDSVYWYENMDGQGGSWSTEHTIGPITDPYEIHIADMDNDGDLDIVVTSSYWAGIDVHWFNNTAGDGSAWTRYNLGSLSYGFGLCVADIDNDGDNDTVVTDYWNFGRVYWYENLKGDARTWSTAYYIDSNLNWIRWPFAVDVGDIDNDGNLDVAAVGDSELVWYEAPNNPHASWTDHSIDYFNTLGPYSDVYLGDIGTTFEPPDGNLDIITNSYFNCDMRWYRNRGNPIVNGWAANIIESDINNWTTYNNVFFGNIDNVDYVDIVATVDGSGTTDVFWVKVCSGYPTNVTLDIGNNGNIEWTGPIGMFNNTVVLPDLTSDLNTVLGTATTVNSDEYGNWYVNMNLKFATDAAGVITVDNIDIKYDFTTVVCINPHNNELAEELEELLFGVQTPEVTIPMVFSSQTEGRLKVSGIYVEYNAYPKLTREIPSDRSIDEDSYEDRLIDLSEYFSDDYLDSTELTYNVIKNSKASIIDIYIQELDQCPYLGVDCLNGSENDDWYGTVEVKVNATDDEGLTVDSNELVITVNPVNDEPTVGNVKIPNITFYEGGISSPIFLAETYYFYDIEDDHLYFNYTVDPDELYFNEQLEVDIDTITGELRVVSIDEWWNGENIPLRIYCDDDPVFEPEDNPFQDLYVNIISLNDDAPQWDDIPDTHIPEDTPTYNAIDLVDYISDMDDELDDLIFSIVSNSEPSKVKIVLGTDNKIDIIPIEENYTGSAEIVVRVRDSAGNFEEQTFIVYIDPINDAPLVTPVSPVNNGIANSLDVTLKWSVLDVDNSLDELSYDIYFGATKPISVYESGYNDTTYLLEGLTNGKTYYWEVIPNDDTGPGSCVGGVHSFKIDTSYQLPTTTLYLPKNSAEVTQNTSELSWTAHSPYNKALIYDVYFDTDPSPTTLVANNREETSFIVNNLNDGTTYYWTVVPFDENIEGVCISGTWDFTVNIKTYGVTVTMNVDEITIRQGEEAVYEVVITNEGNYNDVVVPGLDASRLGNNLLLEDMGKSIPMAPSEAITLEFTLNIPENQPSKTYAITISANSESGGVSDSLEIPIEVLEKPATKAKDEEGLAMEYTFGAAIVGILILFVVLFMFIRWRRLRAKEAVEEAEAAAELQAARSAAAAAPPPGMLAPAAIPPPDGYSSAALAPQFGAAAPSGGLPTSPQMLALPPPPVAAGPEQLQVQVQPPQSTPSQQPVGYYDPQKTQKN